MISDFGNPKGSNIVNLSCDYLWAINATRKQQIYVLKEIYKNKCDNQFP